jgi:hypothetical protein
MPRAPVASVRVVDLKDRSNAMARSGWFTRGSGRASTIVLSVRVLPREHGGLSLHIVTSSQGGFEVDNVSDQPSFHDVCIRVLDSHDIDLAPIDEADWRHALTQSRKTGGAARV